MAEKGIITRQLAFLFYLFGLQDRIRREQNKIMLNNNKKEIQAQA